jgi:ankyrin repeat protein
MLASRNAGNSQMISLITAGADVHRADTNTLKPIHHACLAGNADALRTLLGSGADATSALGDGRTCLHLAAAEGWADMIRVLIANGAVLEATDALGYTPLLAASMGKASTDTIKALLDLGALPSARTLDGATPLHNIAARGYAPAVSLLIEHGADPMATDNQGRTPLHYIASSPAYLDLSILSELFKHAGDINTRDDKGNTPLDIALLSGRSALAEQLRKAGALRGDQIAK